ncbi:family 16 glycosylhydrolase [Bacillus sp. S34]|nr:family 16 glycosylhydrolase [Bacillus sp. S34]
MLDLDVAGYFVDGSSGSGFGADVSWRDWHTYTTQWVPGKYVKYYLDGKLVMSVTHDVPTTEHRFMFQTGFWGESGNLLIDWVATTE